MASNSGLPKPNIDTQQGSRPFSFEQSSRVNAQASESIEDIYHTPMEQSSNPIVRAVGGREWAGFPEQRFSYVETPIEDSTQTFDDPPDLEAIEAQMRREGRLPDVQSQAGTDLTPSQTPRPPQTPGSSQTPVPARTPEPRPQPEMSQMTIAPRTVPSPGPTPSEKQMPWRMSSAYQRAPPEAQHPAFAAQASGEPTQQQASTGQQQQLQPQPQPEEQAPPYSPGIMKPKTPPPESPSRNATPANVPMSFAPPPNAQRQTSQMVQTNSFSQKPQHNEHFNHALCAMGECGDCDVICCGLFCPCILYGKTSYRLAQKDDGKSGTDLLGYEQCNARCCGYFSACGLFGLLAARLRSNVRKLYSINKSQGFFEDCIRGCCCACCVLIQAEREVKGREEETQKMIGMGAGQNLAQRNGNGHASGSTAQPAGRQDMTWAPN